MKREPATTFLCTAADGKSVYYDDTHSHVATHFEDEPKLKDLVVEALTTHKPTGTGETFPMVVDFHKPIGVTVVVAIDSADKMVYAIRKNRTEDGYAPFTKSRPPQPCSTVAIWLARQKDRYELVSAWIGDVDYMPFPQHPDATAESKAYWRTHAFVWGSQTVEPDTVTTVCPW